MTWQAQSNLQACRARDALAGYRLLVVLAGAMDQGDTPGGPLPAALLM